MEEQNNSRILIHGYLFFDRTSKKFIIPDVYRFEQGILNSEDISLRLSDNVFRVLEDQYQARIIRSKQINQQPIFEEMINFVRQTAKWQEKKAKDQERKKCCNEARREENFKNYITKHTSATYNRNLKKYFKKFGR